MKIAIDFTYIKNRPYSGTFQMGVSILGCLHRAKAEYIALVCGDEDYRYMYDQGFCVEQINLPSNRILRNIARIYYFLRTHDNYRDIIYIGSFNPIFWLRKGTILIHDFYILDIPHAYDWMQRMYYKLIVMNSIRFAENCIVTTKVNMNRLYYYFPGLRNIYLYSLAQEFEIKVNDKPQTINYYEILLVLTLSPNKRWEVLLEQAAKLNQINPKKYLFHLVTPQKDFFEIEVKTRYPDLPIRYHQNLTQKEMMRLYKRIDIFWSASIIEGFGMPVRLATLANSYVITPDTDINKESSLGLGEYYNVNDGDAHAKITSRITEFQGNDDRIKKLKKAVEYINGINDEFISNYLGYITVKAR